MSSAGGAPARRTVFYEAGDGLHKVGSAEKSVARRHCHRDFTY